MSEEITNKTEHDGDAGYNRRHFMRIATLTAGSALLAACGQSSPAPPSLPKVPVLDPAAITATAAASTGKTYFPSPAPGVPDAFTAPLPAFQSVASVPGKGGTVNVFTITYAAPETPKNMNRFWQELEKQLNVTWNVNYAVGNTNYAEKVGTLLASGNLPDLFRLNTGIAPSLLQAIQQGAFTDLTSYLSASALNDYPNLARFPSLLWKNVAINGKIYGVPRPFGFTGGTSLYRKDWAQKVGMPEPKNANDFYKLMQAFTKGDPDGDGAADTWGMGFDASSIATHPFFMNIFNVPNKWRLEANGSLTYFIQTGEYRQAIAFIAKLFAAGFFYPNSLTYTGLQIKQAFTAGKIGMYNDGFSALYDQRTKMKMLNPQADVGVMVPFPANGGKANYNLSRGFLGFTGIPSSVGSNTDRVKELLHILDYLAAPTFSAEANFLSLGIDGWDNKAGPHGIKALTPTGTNEIGSLTNIMSGPVIYYYPSDLPLAPVAQEYTRRLLAIGIYNPVEGLASPTAMKQQPTLDTLINDRVLRIVRGIDPLSALNDLIKQWQSQGGTQIAQEYAKALHG
jgi:putative aldouronate transport system substrate-binding protein